MRSNRALVILVPLALSIDRLAEYRATPIKGRLVIFSGLLILFLTFSYDHLSALRALRPLEFLSPVLSA